MNEAPDRPDLECPVDIPVNGYYSDLQSQLNVSRKDKFILIMDIPSILKPYLKTDERLCNSVSLDRLQLTIWGHVVPEIQVPKLDKPYGGQVFKVSSFSRPTYPTITVNYTIDNKFDNYYILYTWLNLQNDQTASVFNAQNYGGPGHGRGLVKDYTTTINVYALDEYDKPVICYEYHGAFPTALGGINASHRDAKENDSTFSFDFTRLHVARTSQLNN
jgi:hypothetical protein